MPLESPAPPKRETVRREARSGRGDAPMPLAGAADRVDLLDEPDRAALLAGELAQRLEEASGSRRADIPCHID